MVNVADLLARPELGLTGTHVPAPEAPVRWVATSELVDPTPYLEGAEVLLTTGLETADWREEWHDYADRLAAAGVAALGLAVGLTHRRPPRQLLAACRRAELNFFEVPPATTFVAISRVTATMLEAERESLTRRALDAQRTLTQAALAVDGTATLVERLADLVGGAAATVTRGGEPIDGPHGPRAGDLDLAVVSAEVSRIRPQGLRAAASASGREGTTVVRPLGVRSRPERWLAAFVPGRLTDADRVAVNTTVSLLSLALERQREQRSTDRQLRARAVELLIADDPRTARIVLGAASATVGSTPRLPGRLRVLRGRGGTEAVEDALTLLEGERVLAAVLDTGPSPELVAVAGTQRAAAVAADLVARGLQVGVGRSATVEQGSTSHDTAGHALAATATTVPLRTWEDLARGGVVGLLGPERAVAFAQSFLAPLAEDPVLVETLAAFLRRHGSRGETAVELGVHRNTIRNRVEQIEARLGASLDDPQVRVDAWVALQVSGRPPGP